jgi:hypothetical protein
VTRNPRFFTIDPENFHPQIGRYVLKDRMGEVGLGQLWRARDTEAGIDVVLTEEGDETALAVRDSILSERGEGPESDRRRYREDRFLNEMETVSLFRGGHVCRIVDYGLQQVKTEIDSHQ